jgi:hypothetical protein
MRPLPIPDGVAEAMGGHRVVFEEADPTRNDVRPCEYVVAPSELYPGRPVVSALIEVGDEDRAAIAEGARLWLHLQGDELPWSLPWLITLEALS